MDKSSHEYAEKLKATAEWLLTKPEFELPNAGNSIYIGNYWTDKDKFIAAVKALAPGKKKFDGSDLEFQTTTPIILWIRVSRSVVCRKVQEEKWECEPLLSPEEETVVAEAAE